AAGSYSDDIGSLPHSVSRPRVARRSAVSNATPVIGRIETAFSPSRGQGRPASLWQRTKACWEVADDFFAFDGACRECGAGGNRLHGPCRPAESQAHPRLRFL